MTNNLELGRDRHADVLALLAGHCPDLPLSGTEIAHVRWGGVDAAIAYLPNHAEQARRRRAGLTAVTRLDQLDLMMDLPAGLPVHPGSLTEPSRRMIKRLPRGCVEATPDGVTRLIVKPLDVRLAIVSKTLWRAGLKYTSRFAPYCNRVLTLWGEPKDLGQAATEADFWGIGLVVNFKTSPRLVVAPERFEQYRHTPAGWSFAEEIWRQIDLERARS